MMFVNRKHLPRIWVDVAKSLREPSSGNYRKRKGISDESHKPQNFCTRNKIHL